MFKKSLPTSNMVTKNKNKVISCSTPEHKVDSPSRDSGDSVYDSDTASPVPFLCTQDGGAEGETDVIWNYYTPKNEHTAKSRIKNSTPITRKSKKLLESQITERHLPRRRHVRVSQKNLELFQDLIELNQNLHEIINKKSQLCDFMDKQQSGSEEDIFSNSPDQSPKTCIKSNNRCLRKNLLSSKFSKPEPEVALESDDSMNECLIKASQMVEENIMEHNKPVKYLESNNNIPKKAYNLKMDTDSMDAILLSIQLQSPGLNKLKKNESPKLNNDSFDSYMGNINDSVFEQPTQEIKVNESFKNKSTTNNWKIQELVVHDIPSSRSMFFRHSSMPESPSIGAPVPSTSGMVLGRYNSMPYDKNETKALEDSPLRCTPDEIKRKHQLARDKLLAKRLLPFTSSQQNNQSLSSHQDCFTKKKIKSEQTMDSSAINNVIDENEDKSSHNTLTTNKKNNVNNVKLIIEKKRQEALTRLRRRQHQNNM